MTDHKSFSPASFVLATTSLVVLLGALILGIAAAEEPYHIDELRQVRSYDKPTPDIVEASTQQEQPPLDAILNSTAQRLIGVGDLQQRALSVLFGIGSLILLGALLFQAGFTTGIPVAVAYAAFSPLLVSVTAYARPYALPTFLTLAFVLAVDLYLRNGSFVVLTFATISALLLPLSRTIEPELVLLLIATAMGIMAYRRVGPGTRSRQLIIAGIAIGSILVVGIPTIRRLTGQLGDYTTEGPLSNISSTTRLVTDLPEVLASITPLWPIVAVAIVATLASPASRGRLIGTWWWWVHVGTAVGFAVVFFASTPASQPYFDRYAYSFVIPTAIVLGAMADGWLEARNPWQGRIAGGVVVTVLVATIVPLFNNLTTTQNADWKHASEVIDSAVSSDTFILFDSVRDLGLYRTPYAGFPRYTGTNRQFVLSLDVIRHPDRVPDDTPVSVLLLGQSVDIDGWTRIPAGSGFTLYVPSTPHLGPDGTIEAALAFGEALGPDTGSAFTLAGAALLQHAGDERGATSTVMRLLEQSDEGLRTAIQSTVSSVPLSSSLPAG